MQSGAVCSLMNMYYTQYAFTRQVFVASVHGTIPYFTIPFGEGLTGGGVLPMV